MNLHRSSAVGKKFHEICRLKFAEGGGASRIPIGFTIAAPTVSMVQCRWILHSMDVVCSPEVGGSFGGSASGIHISKMLHFGNRSHMRIGHFRLSAEFERVIRQLGSFAKFGIHYCLETTMNSDLGATVGLVEIGDADQIKR